MRCAATVLVDGHEKGRRGVVRRTAGRIAGAAATCAGLRTFLRASQDEMNCFLIVKAAHGLAQSAR